MARTIAGTAALVTNEDASEAIPVWLTGASSYTVIAACEAVTGWTVLNDDTANISTSTTHVHGVNSLEFDKVDGAGNSTTAMIEKIGITAIDLSDYMPQGSLLWTLYLSSITNVAYVIIRLGTDASNYNEWRVPVAELVANWNNLQVALDAPDGANSAGTGMNQAAVTYVAVGVIFLTAGNTLANILVDRVSVTADCAFRVTDDGAITVLKTINTAVGGALVVDSIGNAVIDVGVGASTLIVAAPGANHQLWILAIHFTAGGAAGTIQLEDSDGTDLTAASEYSQKGGMALSCGGNIYAPLYKLVTNKAFHVKTVTCTAEGGCTYAIVDVS